MIIAVAWAFACFLFYKVAFDGMLDEISIVGALLCGAVTGAAVFAVAGVYAWRLVRYNLSPGVTTSTAGELVRRTVLAFFGIAIVHAFAIRLIIFGFSKDLNRDLRLFRRDFPTDDFYMFVAIVTLPVFAHYVMSILGTYLTTARPENSLPPTMREFEDGKPRARPDRFPFPPVDRQ